MKRALYSASLPQFYVTSAEEVCGTITTGHTQEIVHEQTGAWLTQVEVLRREQLFSPEGHIFFEFLIPRMGRRADVVLLYRGVLYVIEFKAGEKAYRSGDIRQAEGYALDLRNFHQGSHDKTIVPILVATDAPTASWQLDFPDQGFGGRVAKPICTNAKALHQVIDQIADTLALPEITEVSGWESSPYMPTPTIIEAAQALYGDHQVEEIARHDAGAINLNQTSQCLDSIIHQARLEKRKVICFVTGVPGAGKTLVGLNVATNHANPEDEEHAVFLSGNGPLVSVLREALARDEVQRLGGAISKTQARRKVESMVQNIHHFRDEYVQNNDAPKDKVVIFDEAQRAWDRAIASDFMRRKRGQRNFDKSEPEFLIEVMDRHSDWCAIVTLIGGGQEINKGEAGLSGWIDALASRFPDWQVHYSNQLKQAEYAGGSVDLKLLGSRGQSTNALHLAASMRSFRAEYLSHFVHHLIHNDSYQAAEYFAKLRGNYPIKLTRDLTRAKAWLKSMARGVDSLGMVAASDSQRLKAEGIFVKNEIDPAVWFLNDPKDIRSSHFLEDVATEFDVQGLELDWVLVAWDANYRYTNGQFEQWQFAGTKWQHRRGEAKQRYLENAYRVLLTRARQGMVIFIPAGNDEDSTRKCSFYDETYHYLKACGIPELAIG
ncbi:DUF2075 domain-containing protein [Ferrimonas marina]|uniref:DUF2075 family protein n=1 Tax=Ferrimonas marina TaxID=299255 RepID=A0A1M5X8E4_9GAMM|nr:DUF2075 domain-containing protein [Ferrimonas marina]SHH95848.1 DUF2075 family protein [Ferrimonas marina]